MPNVLLVSRRDLRWFVKNGLTAPVDTLLAERGVDFGDGYTRDALEAFSADAACSACRTTSRRWSSTTTSLVDLDRMASRGSTPGATTGGGLDQFVAAAKFAARPSATPGRHDRPDPGRVRPVRVVRRWRRRRRRHRPDDAHVQRRELAGRPRDDPDRCSATRELTLSQEQLDEKSPLERFKDGKLGMILGYRAMVPELRAVPGPELRRDAAPADRGSGDRRRDHRPVHLAGRREPREAADFWSRLEHRSGERGPARGLRDAGQPRGRAQRRLPAARGASAARRGLRRGRRADGDPPAARHLGRAGGRGRAAPPGAVLRRPTIDLPLLGAEIDAASLPIFNPETPTPTPETEAVGSDPDSVSRLGSRLVGCQDGVGEQRRGQVDLPARAPSRAARPSRPGQRSRSRVAGGFHSTRRR